MRAYSSFRSIFTEPQVKTRCVTFLKSQGNNANWNANGFKSETPFSPKRFISLEMRARRRRSVISDK